MMTIDARQRTCSYCGGSPFETREAFSQHWSHCPVRIKLGYIPVPLDMIPERVQALQQQARKKLQEAQDMLAEADMLNERLRNETPSAQTA